MKRSCLAAAVVAAAIGISPAQAQIFDLSKYPD